MNAAFDDVAYDWCFVNTPALVADRHEFDMLLRFIRALIREAVAKERAAAIRRALTPSDS